MGHKVNPIGFRININNTWRSRWFNRRTFAKFLAVDAKIRTLLMDSLKKGGVSRIDIERSPQALLVIIHASRPGIIIGKGGSGIEDLKKKIAAFMPGDKTQVRVEIHEIKNPALDAALVGANIAEQLEKRIGFRRAMKQSIEQTMNAGAEGVKIEISGRLDGAEIARREWLVKGTLPLQTLRAVIDYQHTTAFTTYGTIGIKVWINRGRVFSNQQPSDKQNGVAGEQVRPRNRRER